MSSSGASSRCSPAGRHGRTPGPRGAPFVLEIRDLWPDALVVKKAISPLQARPLHWMVRHPLQKVSPHRQPHAGHQTGTREEGRTCRQGRRVPQRLQPGALRVPSGTREEVRRKYGWGDDFVVIYTGSFQEVTAVEVYVRAAAGLKNHPGIRVALFGAGPTQNRGRTGWPQSWTCANVEFHDPVPKKDVPALLAAADVGLMALFRSPLVHIYFENKLMDYMGAGLPILAAMDGPQARMISDNAAGRVTAAFDHEGLARLILEARQDASSRRQMGENGRRRGHGQATTAAHPQQVRRHRRSLRARPRPAASSLGTAVNQGWPIFSSGFCSFCRPCCRAAGFWPRAGWAGSSTCRML